MSVRTEPRFTADIDLTVAVEDDQQAENVVNELMSRGFQTELSTLQTATARLGSTRLRHARFNDDAVACDLLFAISGIEEEIVEQAEVMAVVESLTIPVARTGHLLALKLLSDSTDRPQDSVDARALLLSCDDHELSLARSACEAIVARGYGRGKDLVADLDRLG